MSPSGAGPFRAAPRTIWPAARGGCEGRFPRPQLFRAKHDPESGRDAARGMGATSIGRTPAGYFARTLPKPVHWGAAPKRSKTAGHLPVAKGRAFIDEGNRLRGADH